MSAERGTLEIVEWRPPVARRDESPPAPGPSGLVGRSVVTFAVIALHLAALALFALPPSPRKISGMTYEDRVMTAMLVSDEKDLGEGSPPSLEPPHMEMPMEIPDMGSPQLLVDVVDADPSENNEFRPPRIDERHQVSPESFAADAGIAMTQAVRVILTVTVSERGNATEVRIAVSCGIPALDAAAAAYARALRWQPALVRGRESKMSIRLPVVFPATG